MLFIWLRRFLGLFALAVLASAAAGLAERSTAGRSADRSDFPLMFVEAQAPEFRLPTGVKVLEGLEYRRVGDVSLQLDLYLPDSAASEPIPVLVWLHGGGWRIGNRSNPPAVDLVPRGMAVASVDYRLSDVAKFPAPIADCREAVRWLRRHATEYGLDTKRMGAWGVGAGGHLALLLGTGADSPLLDDSECHSDVSCAIQAVAACSAPAFLGRSLQADIDLDDPIAVFEDEFSPTAHLLGGPVSQNQDLAWLASPIAHLRPEQQRLPDFCLLHGQSDALVPAAHGRRLSRELITAGADVHLITIDGPLKETPLTVGLIDVVSDFFRSSLLGATLPEPLGAALMRQQADYLEREQRLVIRDRRTFDAIHRDRKRVPSQLRADVDPE